ncbi:hypothetical protein FD29_GL001917 [Companilactobacillus mindensis DSM 14500]|uniref:Uncharacterized protein n=1 Tax=Companilactobacillus mindensis DSM 14500 TaxID=1423770 RepID=A0A0R1QTU0_9LACO|nr:hypothetical protein [Companilactobacillus mindensis]KRL45914.1 hypothetical protein FD29_GL001917 [Companilactobacillus mindensis DSM 14500]GEO77777.1 hypothetical protein LMI01_01080 [Companilactobacillus mindensis]
MKRELLKDLNLTDDQVDKIMSEYGKNFQEINVKLADTEQERDSFKTQIADCDTQIKELSEKIDNSNNNHKTKTLS